MNIGEKVQIIEEGFVETIKPFIENGKVRLAYNEMQNLSLTLLAELKQYSKYHSGINFVANAILLTDALKINDPRGYTKFMTNFQAYLSQLKLAVAADNTF